MSSKTSKRTQWQKIAIEITAVRETPRPEIVEVELATTGKPMRLRRDLVDFCYGTVLMPRWLAEKLPA
jgi:hypothetical protein